MLITHFECSLARADPIFGVLALGDVDIAAKIAGVAAVGRVLGNPRSEEPSVLAVGVTQSILQVKWLPRLERRRICGEASVDILWMDEVQPAVLSQLFERAARQLHAKAIEVVERR